MTAAHVLLEEDSTILLERALLRQTLCAFGEDGCGKYGRKNVPSYFDVVDIRVDVEAASPPYVGKLSICLRGYDANDVGHIQTDKNFDISLNAALTAAGIPSDVLSWASISEQVQGCVTFHLDVAKLLGY